MITYYDISSFQRGMSVKGLVVCVKATQGTSYVNPYYETWVAQAAYAWGYHFLEHGNAAAQAQHYHSVAGKTPCMIDCEPDGSSKPTVADCVTFATELRRLGGVCELAYFPKWYAGAQSLKGLSQAGLKLVSSNYTSYSDSGPGWASYGGLTPVVWQYTDKAKVNGYAVDANAFKGTLDELKALVDGTTKDDDMTPTQAAQLARIEEAVTGHGIASAGYRLMKNGESAEYGGATDVHQMWNDTAKNAASAASQTSALAERVDALEATLTAIAKKIGI